MPNADSNYSRLSFWPEVSFNTLNASTMALQNLPMTKESITFDKKTQVSAEIRSDRMVQDTVWVGADVNGTFDFELSDYSVWAGTFLTAGLMADTTIVTSHSSLVGATLTKISNIETQISVPAATAVLTSTANYANTDTVTVGATTYTFKTALTGAANEILVGVSEAASIANLIGAVLASVTGGQGPGATYGIGTVANASATAVGATHTVTFTAIVPGSTGNSVASTEAATNASFGGTTFTGGGAIALTLPKLGRAITFKNLLAVNGSTVGATVVAVTNNTFNIRPYVGTGSASASAEYSNVEFKNGKTRQSFFIEKFFSDLTESIGFTGMMVDELNLTFDAQKIITGSMKLIGCGYADNGSFTPASRTGTSGNVLSASTNVGAVQLGGLSAMVKTAKIMLKNNLREQPYIGSIYSGGIGVGRCEITGSIDVYFNDIATYQAMTSNALVNIILGVNLNGYALAIYLPQVRLLKGDPSADGINRDIMLTLDFESVLVGNSENATIICSTGTTP